MDVETFFGETQGSVANLMAKELHDLDVMKAQTTVWIQFKVEVDGDGNVFRVDEVRQVFNSWMMEVFQGSDLNEIIDKMFAHMKTQVKNPALANRRFVFNPVLSLDVSFHQLNLLQGSSYLPLPGWILSKKAIINPQNEEDEDCLKWAMFAALNHERIELHPERISNLRRLESSYIGED